MKSLHSSPLTTAISRPCNRACCPPAPARQPVGAPLTAAVLIKHDDTDKVALKSSTAAPYSGVALSQPTLSQPRHPVLPGSTSLYSHHHCHPHTTSPPCNLPACWPQCSLRPTSPAHPCCLRVQHASVHGSRGASATLHESAANTPYY